MLSSLSVAINHLSCILIINVVDKHNVGKNSEAYLLSYLYTFSFPIFLDILSLSNGLCLIVTLSYTDLNVLIVIYYAYPSKKD